MGANIAVKMAMDIGEGKLGIDHVGTLCCYRKVQSIIKTLCATTPAKCATALLVVAYLRKEGG
ncbi:hypothetical protein GCM10027361_04380 [Erwinia aphidicola]